MKFKVAEARKAEDKIAITSREWDLLDRLTDKAGMDWFLVETTIPEYDDGVLVTVNPKEYLTKEQAESAAEAFMPENLEGMGKDDILDIYAVFKRAGVADNYMKDVLVDCMLEGR